jgi:membrane protease YdiL (CAAX protease family)
MSERTTMSEMPELSVDPEIPLISSSGDPVVGTEFSAPAQPKSGARPWGPWATISWTLLCICVLFAAQIAAAIFFALFRVATTGNMKVDDLGTNGNLIALATVFSTSATIGLIALLVYIRGYAYRDYLALYWPSGRQALIALLGLTVLLVATDATSYFLGKPLVPTFTVPVYQSSWLPALLLALVVLAPLGEETLFRGFLYKGLAASRGGAVLAIFISSITFALLHAFQYDLYAVAGVTAMGFLLGYIRYRSGSLLLLLHAVGNAVATLELIVQEHWLK